MPSSGYLAKPSLPSSGEIHTEIAPQDRTNRTEIAPQDRTDLSLSWSGATVLCWYWSISHSLFFSQFDRIWWIFVGWVLFLLYLSIEKWYYIFVWKLRKCEKQVENVFSILFSRTQPNTRKYFPKHFLECNQTLENIFFFRKYFPFPKIFYIQPNTTLGTLRARLVRDF